MAQSLSFAELSFAIDPSSAKNIKESKPLCENIFDVPRSELFETYERLRQAFWTDTPIVAVGTTATTTTKYTTPTTSSYNINNDIEMIPTSASPTKRQLSEPETPQQSSFGKRRRVDSSSATELSLKPTIQPQNQQQQQLCASAVIPSLMTLWGLKRIMIQQLRCSLPSYDETKMTMVIEQCDQQCNQEQKQHLKQYMEPILIATRRHCPALEEALKRWQR
ncbi:hypothetical protein BDB00DRAFT_869368 [Zychaea mexicana]|uniref:uncharacterized protein n=1 Tax=Zychaea mexicana TaxID=64656 RepID=UPI0022FE92BB|nr:uncharacterized protein BDB00DRAFT_869368 [Zychaea mexicana]KAI9496428.1 hypothetical protein BDB00DRAFT_869368 [Zychaea mexicana]